MMQPKKICLDASTVCQLKCIACPTSSGEIGKSLKSGHLKLSDFKTIIDKNPRIISVELSNWGEIFLNKELSDIIKYAYYKNVALTASNGTNINHADEDVLERLVKYKFRKIKCSIDGACQNTYSKYRKNGIFENVIKNIEIINRFKKQYNSFFPILYWQFIIFGHNVHEVNAARELARELNMIFSTKLSWDDLYISSFPKITNADLIRKASGLGVSSRKEFRDKYNKEYLPNCCLKLWNSPQINHDGRLLGCSVNYWDDYGNILDDGLSNCINSAKADEARKMLMGKIEGKDSIPCNHCKFYKWRKETGAWINDADINTNVLKDMFTGSRFKVMLENKLLHYKFLNIAFEKIFIRKNLMKNRRRNELKQNNEFKSPNLIGSNVYSLNIPLKFSGEQEWKHFSIFRGLTHGLSSLTCHASALSFNHSPHIPHSHKEEELLLILSGSVDLLIPDIDSNNEIKNIRLEKGQCVYYPSFFAHSLKTISKPPANYLMFKWCNKPARNKLDAALTFSSFDLFEQGNILESQKSQKSFYKKLIFEGPTDFLKKLNCHISVLKPGAGYKPHSDPYDVAIVVLEGVVETINQSTNPYDVIFYREGKAHGMYNPGIENARYIVFEFHSNKKLLARRFFNAVVYFFNKVTDLNRWKRKIKHIINI